MADRPPFVYRIDPDREPSFLAFVGVVAIAMLIMGGLLSACYYMWPL